MNLLDSGLHAVMVALEARLKVFLFLCLDFPPPLAAEIILYL